METNRRPGLDFSDEYYEFLRLRGRNTAIERITKPETEKDLAKAGQRTSTLLALIQNPDFEPIRLQLLPLAHLWLKQGKLTEAQVMEIVRTYERLTDGETYEEWHARIESRRPENQQKS